MSKLVTKETFEAEWNELVAPLRAYFDDPSITEIMVNGPSKIFVEQKGVIKKSSARFEDHKALYKLLQLMAKMAGKTLTKESPYIDGRLPDGSRINIVMNPVCVDGIALTVRKFSKTVLSHKQLITEESMNDRMAFFLNCCVAAKLNIIISGGTGSGKTTLLNVLSSFIGTHERVITIEEDAELQLRNENLVRLETAPGHSGERHFQIGELVRNALRMRPDRIIIGECRGSEAFDMLSAMNTGHNGSMTTLHANTARDALKRLETMIMLSGLDIPTKVVRTYIASAIHLVVHVNRGLDGKRKVTEIVELAGMEGETILTQDIYVYNPSKGFMTTGFVPRFVSLFKERGVDFPKDFFTDRYNVNS